MNACMTAFSKLETSENKYREIFDSPNDAILIHDAETGEILDVNRSMLEMYGVTREQALGRTPWDLSVLEPPFTEEEALNRIQMAITEGPQVFDWRAKRSDGHPFWIEVSLKYVVIGEGPVVMAVVRNTDDRRRTEQALATERQRLSVTLRSIGEAVITTDIAGKILLINRVAEQLCGTGQDNTVGASIDTILHLVDENGHDLSLETILKASPETARDAIPLRTLMLQPGGELRNISISNAPVLDSEGVGMGNVLVFRDITSLLKTEEEMLKIRKLESVGVLAGGIAHDFNNILVAILGNLDLAKRMTPSDHECRHLLEEAEKASLRARDLTRQLLTFARGGDPVRETASLGELIRQSVDFVLHGTSTISEFSIPEDLWLVEVDTGQMGQVMQNLALNASQAMSGAGQIKISCANVGDIIQETFPGLPVGPYVKIRFSDSGIGIPDSIIEKVFDPYFSTKSEGSGLGLAVVHSIITKHRGRIHVESKPGRGTSFSIFLPAIESSTQAAASETQDPASPSMTVLLMDDDPNVLNIGKKMLAYLGHTVVLADNGAEAVRLFEESRTGGQPIDVLILDLTIPGGIGGTEALRRIKEIDPSACAIVSSGYSHDTVMSDFETHGFRAAIAKPFGLDELNRALGAASH
jgi:PAS domain S-box-containing protein